MRIEDSQLGMPSDELAGGAGDACRYLGGDVREKFTNKVQIFIENYHMIKKGDRILAGVSGGADSVCLLLALHGLEKKMGFSLAAVHVEHGIRGEESLADAAFTEELCEQLGVPFQKFSVDAPAYAAQNHRSLEEAARELRYGCFARACGEFGADKVAVAHHANDNAETMLFHLARGSGIRGLGGIPPMTVYRVGENVSGVGGFLTGTAGRTDGEGLCVIRPLLGVTRAEIEEYLAACGQAYRVDSSNADMAYARNRIRARILPGLCEVNGQAVSHMEKTAGRLREICEYLDEAAFREGAGAYAAVHGNIQIYSEPFLKMHRVLQEILVHRLIGGIAGSRKDITSEHVEQVLALFGMREGKRTDLPYGVSARRVSDGVELFHRGLKPQDGCVSAEMDAPGVLEEEICYDFPVPGELSLENGARIRAKLFDFDGNFEKIPKKTYTKWMDYDKIKNTFQIRTRRPGDYLEIDAQGAKKKLRRYFIDEKIAPPERDRLLLAADGSHVLWVIGHRISEGCKVTKETRHVLCLKYFTEEDDGREN